MATLPMYNALILAEKGKKGHERQAEAVARRLGAAITIVYVTSRSRLMLPPNIDVVLAAGRQAIAPAGRIASLPPPRPRVAVLQPVAWRPGRFDLVWAPVHDQNAVRFARDRRIETLTAPSMVTAADRRAGAAWLARQADHKGHGGQWYDGSRPIVGVLVGGPTRAHRFGPAEAEEFAARLAALSAAHDAPLLVTTSPRTAPSVTAVLRERLSSTPHLFIDAAQEAGAMDPALAYAGILGAAHALVVTTDSFAMLSDAATTGTPIHGWRLPGGRAKFETFYTRLVDHGAMRWFDGSLEPWTYTPLDAASVVADALRAPGDTHLPERS